jgi:predicted metal-binding membrane protein
VTVWKFQLRIEDLQSVAMPDGAEIIGVADQNDILCMWAIVDPDAAPVVRTFAIVGTGQPIPPHAVYVHSARMRDSLLVWHVFEVWP